MKNLRKYELNNIRRSRGQIYRCIQAHTVYPGEEETRRPEVFRAAWGIYHGRTLATAKPYVAPLGTSGMYMKDDCFVWTDGNVYRVLVDNYVWTPETYPAGTEIIGRR